MEEFVVDLKLKESENNIMVVDDYAHHPTEVLATLQAARDGWESKNCCSFSTASFFKNKRFL